MPKAEGRSPREHRKKDLRICEQSGNLRNGGNDGPVHVNARNGLGNGRWNIAARI